jgi:hypothetical protein
MKESIQTDCLSCLLQLAVFEPGRELLQNDPATMEALRNMADGRALGKQGQVHAESTLIAIEGVSHVPEPEGTDPGGGGTHEDDEHIMVSYQWDVQVTIERLVRLLQRKKYVVWFDLDLMKGSTMVSTTFDLDVDSMMKSLTRTYRRRLSGSDVAAVSAATYRTVGHCTMLPCPRYLYHVRPAKISVFLNIIDHQTVVTLIC